MNFVKMAWVLGGISAMGMGMMVEACSAAQGTADGGMVITTNTSGAAGTACAQLTACCTMLPPAQAAQCTPILTAASNGGCQTFLTEIQTAGECTGSGTGTSTTTGTTISTTTTSGQTTTNTTQTTQQTQGGDGGQTSTSGNTTGTTSATSSSSCANPPKLFVESAAGVYCPYSGADGGKAQTCAAGEYCCEPSTGTAVCQPASASCATGSGSGGNTKWECLEAIDCASNSGGKLCCGSGTLATQAACGTEPAYAYVTGFTGTTCASSCTAFTVCEQNSDCSALTPSGQTCVATKAKGGDFGHCSTNGM